MHRHILLVLSCLTVLIITACAPASAPLAQATYTAMPLKGDPAVTFKTTGDELLIDITSPTGIGSTAIEKLTGQWPGKIMMRLHTQGLEKFLFQYGNSSVDLSVSSQGDHVIHEVYTQSGKSSAVSAGDPYWIAVTPGSGYYDLEAPADFLKSGENKFTLDWIDYYR